MPTVIPPPESDRLAPGYVHRPNPDRRVIPPSLGVWTMSEVAAVSRALDKKFPRPTMRHHETPHAIGWAGCDRCRADAERNAAVGAYVAERLS